MTANARITIDIIDRLYVPAIVWPSVPEGVGVEVGVGFREGVGVGVGVGFDGACGMGIEV
jgi:hypothetical protein